MTLGPSLDWPSNLGTDQFDLGFAQRALKSANLNAIRLALFQETNDPELAAMPLEQKLVRGGSIVVSSLSRSDRERVVEKALNWLAGDSKSPSLPLTVQNAPDLLRMFGAGVETSSKLDMALEELGLEPRPARKVSEVAADRLGRYSAIIIGAGVSGIAAGIRLKQLGIPFQIIDRQSAVGGTWQLNDYPEARVDISNFIYQYRFESKYPWTHHFATQAEIQGYLQFVVDKYDLAPHIRLDTSVTHAQWNEAERKWQFTLEKAGQNPEQLSANFAISATGLFSTPNLPDIAGLNDFNGRVFHTTGWDHEIDFEGKRAALIGAGSSGVQVMPWIAARASRLTVFQRTPNWMAPVEGYHRPVDRGQQWLFDRLPHYRNWFCFGMSMIDKQSEALQVEDADWMKAHGQFSEKNQNMRRFLEAHVRMKLSGRPDLIAKCLPSYPPLARRLVVDNGWFDALLRPNVDLVTDAIDHADRRGIVTKSGAVHPCDVIVLGTGFRASDFLCTVGYVGRGGIGLNELWATDSARAFLGMFLPKFPNLFVFYGPNGQPQTGSFHDWAGRWARVTVDRILEVIESDAQSIEVRDDVFEAYNRELDLAMDRMVWGRDQSSGYYINAFGRPITKLPWKSDEFLSRLNGLGRAEFHIE